MVESSTGKVTRAWGDSVLEAPPAKGLLKPTEAWRAHVIEKREPHYEYVPVFEPLPPPPKEEEHKPIEIIEEVPIIHFQPILQLPPPQPPPPPPPSPPPPPPQKEKSFKASTEFKLNGGLYTDIKGSAPLAHVLETIKPKLEEIKEKLPVLFFPEKVKEKEKEPPPPPPKEPEGKKIEFLKSLVAGKSWAIYFGNVFGQALTQFLAGTQSVLKKVTQGPEPELHFPEK